MRLRGLKFVAATLVTAGVVLIATDASVAIARGMLIAGLFYAMVALWLDWRGRS